MFYIVLFRAEKKSLKRIKWPFFYTFITLTIKEQNMFYIVLFRAERKSLKRIKWPFFYTFTT